MNYRSCSHWPFPLLCGQGNSAESLETMTLESQTPPLCPAKWRKLRMKRRKQTTGVMIVSCCFLQRIIATVTVYWVLTSCETLSHLISARGNFLLPPFCRWGNASTGRWNNSGSQGNSSLPSFQLASSLLPFLPSLSPAVFLLSAVDRIWVQAGQLQSSCFPSCSCYLCCHLLTMTNTC